MKRKNNNINAICCIESSLAFLLFLLYKKEDCNYLIITLKNFKKEMKKNKFFKTKGITIISPVFLKKNLLYKEKDLPIKQEKETFFLRKIKGIYIVIINFLIKIEINRAKRKVKSIKEIELYFQPHCISYKFFLLLEIEEKNIIRNFIEDGLGTWNVKYFEEYSYIIKKIKINNFIFSDLIAEKEKNTIKFIEQKYSNSKLVLLNLTSTWEKSNKSEINNFFNWKNINFSNNDVLLLTQPLSEDKILSKKQKKCLYKEIVNNLQINSRKNLIVKIHPREKFNYKYLNPKCIIKGIVPSELLYLNGNKPSKIITFYSGGVNIFEESSLVEIYKKDF